MTVTAPFANPTANCERSSRAVKAETWHVSAPPATRIQKRNHRMWLTGNCFFPLCTLSVLKQVGSPVFLAGLSRAQTFKTGSLLRSSCCLSAFVNRYISVGFTYGNSDQKTRAFNLAHVCYLARLVSQEAPDHLPGRPDDAYVAIEAAEEETVGAGADAGYLVVLEEGPRLVVAQFDLAHFKEVECFPLCSAICG